MPVFAGFPDPIRKDPFWGKEDNNKSQNQIEDELNLQYAVAHHKTQFYIIYTQKNSAQNVEKLVNRAKAQFADSRVQFVVWEDSNNDLAAYTNFASLNGKTVIRLKHAP